MQKRAVDEGERLLSSIRKGVSRRFSNMTETELDEYFFDMSASELKNYSDLIFKQQPPDVDLNREVLSITASFEHLPSLDALSEKCYIYRCELKRVANELQMQRDIYERFLKQIKDKDFYVRKETKLHDCFKISTEELGHFAVLMADCIKGLFAYIRDRDATGISKETWTKHVTEIIGDSFKPLGKRAPASKDWTPLAPLVFDSEPNIPIPDDGTA